MNSITRGMVSYHNMSEYSQFGWIGVEIFFVISGLVISLSASQSSPKDFFRGRFLRLVPAAWICSTITLVFALYAKDGSAHEILLRYIRSVTFFPKGSQIDGSYWTLGIEISFYTCIFFMLYIQQWKRFTTLILILTIMSTAYNIFIYNAENPQAYLKRYYDIMLLRHGCEFSLGALIYRIKFYSIKPIYVILVFISLIGGTYECLTQATHNNLDKPIVLSIWLASCLVLFLFVLFNERISSGISESTRKMVRQMGIMTYPLYLIHQVVGGVFLYYFVIWGIEKHAALLLTISIILILTFFISTIEPHLKNILKTALDHLLPQTIAPHTEKKY